MVLGNLIILKDLSLQEGMIQRVRIHTSMCTCVEWQAPAAKKTKRFPSTHTCTRWLQLKTLQDGFRTVLPPDELERVQLGLRIPVTFSVVKPLITTLFQNSCSCHPFGGTNLEELRYHCKHSLAGRK